MLRFTTFLTAAAITAACTAQSYENKPMAKDIVDTAVGAGQFETLVTAVKAAELVETLKGKGPFTVFAPNDAAFAKLPEDAIPGLLKDKPQLTGVLTYHVVPGKLMAKDVVGSQWLETVQGQSLMVSAQDDGVMIDGAKVLKTDIVCSNGVIHVIDSVVMPRQNIVDTAVAAGSFETLATAVTKAKLAKTLEGDGPFTVFAPNDAAFAKLPDGTVAGLLEDIPALQGILKYHVIEGRVLSTDLPMKKTVTPTTLNGQKLSVACGKDGVTVDGAKVIRADIVCGNGVIHVIDSVVLPKTAEASSTR